MITHTWRMGGGAALRPATVVEVDDDAEVVPAEQAPASATSPVTAAVAASRPSPRIGSAWPRPRPAASPGRYAPASMAPRSAGLLLYRRGPGGLEVLLVHPGGPLWARRDAGAWSVPKGEPEPGEDPLVTAEREFAEELGQPPPAGHRLPLGEVRQAGGKRVEVWAVEGDLDVAEVTSGTFEMPWPPGSGRRARFPEVDRAEWFGLAEAASRLVGGQVPLLERLAVALDRGPDGG